MLCNIDFTFERVVMRMSWIESYSGQEQEQMTGYQKGSKLRVFDELPNMADQQFSRCPGMAGEGNNLFSDLCCQQSDSAFATQECHFVPSATRCRALAAYQSRHVSEDVKAPTPFADRQLRRAWTSLGSGTSYAWLA
jgi:hypothetical protein